jgi:ABC-type sugar transport system ATPase subunit
MRLSSSKTTEAQFKTLEGGHTLHLSLNSDDLQPLNQPVFLAIRPEHVGISSTSSNGNTPNTLKAEVREIVFGGATSMVRVDANGLALEALVLQPDALRVGSICEVRLPAERLSALKNA